MTLKGIGYGDDNTTDIARINALNVKWWYNWDQKRKQGTKATIPTEFVPMLFSDSPTRLATFAADIAAHKAEVPKTITSILGPNEPDWFSDRQPNGVPNLKMTPLETLNMWEYIQDNGFGLRKGSPACVSPSRTWNDQFMYARDALDQTKSSTARDFEVNFVATHIYQGPIVNDFFKKVDSLYDRFGKPVWVTETCVHDTKAHDEIWYEADGVTVKELPRANQYSRAQVEDYMREIWAGAKTRPWLERIAWHTRNITDVVGVSGSLFNDSEDNIGEPSEPGPNQSLTSTGVVWRDLDKND